MAFFEDVGKKLSKAGQGVAQTTRNVADKMKLSNAISEEKKNIERLYTAIGEQYFEEYADCAEGELASLVEEVKASFARMSDYNGQLNKLKGIMVCQECGAEIPANAIFCNMCGVRIVRPDPEPEPEPEIVEEEPAVCYVCGADIEPGARFCTRCGTPVMPPEAGDEEPKAE